MEEKSYKNGTMAIANGVMVDCNDRLERVIDHMTSEPQIAETNMKKMDEAWEESQRCIHVYEHPLLTLRLFLRCF